jgi:hypothetical protein
MGRHLAWLQGLPERDRRAGQDPEAVGASQEWKPATGVPGLRAEGRQSGTSNERNPDPAASMLETATGRLATIEVNWIVDDGGEIVGQWYVVQLGWRRR